MKQKIAYTVIIAIIAVSSAYAQKCKHEERWEKFHSEKVAFLTSKLELTPDEAQEFWPVYNQMEKEKWEIHKSRRKMEDKIRDTEISLSEKEATKLTRDFAACMQKEADMTIKYNEKFLKILPPQKVLKLYKTENEFRMYMIKKFRDKRKNGG